jgi:hypothetical protein
MGDDQPFEFVALFIVASAGALGRALHILRMTSDDVWVLPRKVYWFDPIFGAMVGVAVYIVIKAGVLVVSDARVLGAATATLNPFLIAFAGLAPGLVSERVIDNLRQSGINWLR